MRSRNIDEMWISRGPQVRRVWLTALSCHALCGCVQALDVGNDMGRFLESLLSSEEPSIRYKIRVGVLCEDRGTRSIGRLQCEIAQSSRVRALLRDRDERGRIRPVHHPYRKWIGAHWVLATLADIGYPSGDKRLIPIRDQVLDCWLAAEAIRERVCTEAPPPHKDRGVPIIQGRARRCASQQGNALFSVVALGLADERCIQLAELLLRWQWPDGGWNCDRRADATHSSFWESLIPLRGLARFAKATGDKNAARAAERAADVFLKRRLYRRLENGQVMNKEFTRLHYPCYWRYDNLFALKVLAEAGFIGDPRCEDALNFLESKRLPDGGWPAEERFYRTGKSPSSGCDLVSWGGVSKRRTNEWVSADALCVLRAAGRLDRTDGR